jgi:YesN/AraC family two-component response regulator
MTGDLSRKLLRETCGRPCCREQSSIDLIITDYAMPKMNGLQLADAIKKEWPELPVVIATGFAEMEQASGPKLPKLLKPFTETELAGALANNVPTIRKSGRVVKFRGSG